MKESAPLRIFLIVILHISLSNGVAFSDVNSSVRIISNGTVNNLASILRTRDRQIVDAYGRSVLLRGVNIVGFYRDQYNYPNFADYQRIREWGFNVVRIRTYWEFIEPTFSSWDTPSYSTDYLNNQLDLAINYASKAGLYIILEMAFWKYSSWFPGGLGTPPWACFQYPQTEEGMNQAITNFWQNDTLKFHYIKLVKFLLSRYKSYPLFVGIDLYNEPQKGYLTESQLSDLLYPFYEVMIDELSAVKNILWVYQPYGIDAWGYAQKVNRTNVVFSPHFYWYSWGYENRTISHLDEKQFAPVYNLSISWNIPVWVGEFGMDFTKPDYSRWILDMTTLFDRYQFGWAWWTFLRSDRPEDYALLWQNGTENENYVPYLTRP